MRKMSSFHLARFHGTAPHLSYLYRMFTGTCCSAPLVVVVVPEVFFSTTRWPLTVSEKPLFANSVAVSAAKSRAQRGKSIDRTKFEMGARGLRSLKETNSTYLPTYLYIPRNFPQEERVVVVVLVAFHHHKRGIIGVVWIHFAADREYKGKRKRRLACCTYLCSTYRKASATTDFFLLSSFPRK